MTRHEEYETMLVWRDELPLADIVRLNRHLERCLDCRQAAAWYEESRARLRTLAQVRPSEELRHAVLVAADSSRDAANIWVSLLAVLLPVPLTLAAAVVVATFGGAGMIGILIALALTATFTALLARRRDARAEMPQSLAVGPVLGTLARGILADAVGVLGGACAFTVVFAAVAYLSGHFL